MDKLKEIKARILENKLELERLNNLPVTTRNMKEVSIQTLNITKSIQRLIGKYEKAGGKKSDLEEKKVIVKEEIVNETKNKTIPSKTKVKKGKK